MKLRAARRQDAAALARLHAEAFDAPWPQEAFASLLATGAAGLIVVDPEPAALILWRAAAGEAEILTLAVRPDRRREGIAGALVEAAAALAAEAGAQALFLEVAADNAPAIGLYEGRGFVRAGLRRGYYARAEGAADALVMRRDLNRGAASPYP